MNQKNHGSEKPRLKKSIVLMVSLFLVSCVAVGGTLAYLSDRSYEVENTFIPSEVTTKVTEEFDGSVKRNVKIQNTGDIAAYIRAAVTVTWQDTQGNICGKVPVMGDDYRMIFNESSDGWVKSDDGFYYWIKPVEADAFTGVLITECQPVTGRAPAGYSLVVEIIGSGIQSVPTTVVLDSWKNVDENCGVIGVASDGTTLIIE